jgi:hypothetical protein
VKRLLAVPLVTTLLLLSSSCGDVFVRGALNTGSQTAIGTVSIVRFTITDSGTTITVVTLPEQGMAQSLNFCGDQRSRFPLDQPIEVTFTPGATCGSVIAIAID